MELEDGEECGCSGAEISCSWLCSNCDRRGRAAIRKNVTIRLVDDTDSEEDGGVKEEEEEEVEAMEM